MEDNLQNKAEGSADEAKKNAEEAPRAANQASGQADEGDSTMKASAETWSQSTPPQPVAPIPPAATPWGTPQSPDLNDPTRWSSGLFSPETDKPQNQAPNPQPRVIDYGQKPADATSQHKPFPWWGILLIVLAILLIGFLCQIGFIFSILALVFR